MKLKKVSEKEYRKKLTRRKDTLVDILKQLDHENNTSFYRCVDDFPLEQKMSIRENFTSQDSIIDIQYFNYLLLLDIKIPESEGYAMSISKAYISKHSNDRLRLKLNNQYYYLKS